MQEGHQPAIMLTALSMLQGDGQLLIDFAKNSPAYRLMPICVLSASTESTRQTRWLDWLELGTDESITKPLDPQLVKAKLQALLRRSTQAGAKYKRAGRLV